MDIKTDNKQYAKLVALGSFIKLPAGYLGVDEHDHDPHTVVDRVNTALKALGLKVERIVSGEKGGYAPPHFFRIVPVDDGKIGIGSRCAFKKGTRWTKGDNFATGQQIIIKKRSGKDFSVFVLRKGFTGELTQDIKLYDNCVSWVHEDEIELVDNNVKENMAFIDWFDSVYDNICGDCLEAFLNKDETCPNKDCPSNHLEDYEDDDEGFEDGYDGFGWQ
jgi:hypothetical protein